jgi:hypothetical protein
VKGRTQVPFADNASKAFNEIGTICVWMTHAGTQSFASEVKKYARVFRAFSSEVDTGSREENASNNKKIERGRDSIQSERALASRS